MSKHNLIPTYDVVKNYSKTAEEYHKYNMKFENFRNEQKLCNCNIYSRVITPDLPRIPYRRRREELKSSLHWGQRKLLLSEIEFLTLHGDKANTIVYVGAADGKHDIYLSKLFPKHKFILYDASKFYPGLVEYSKQNPDKIEIHNEYFLDKDVAEYKDKNILFISDIRTVPDAEHGTEDYDEGMETNVAENMTMQMNWVLGINPAACMLKFRLSYLPGQTKYLDGDLHFQVYPGHTSSETRLIACRPYSKKTYDNTDYEQVCYWHNICPRECTYSVDAFQLIPNNYDVYAEQEILSVYLAKHRPKDKLKDMLSEIEHELGKTLVQKYREKMIKDKDVTNI